MSVSLQETFDWDSGMSAEHRPHAFRVKDYYAIYESGILPAEKRYELIRGEIFDVSPSSPGHAALIGRLNALLFSLSREEHFTVRIQAPLQLGDFSEPEPDVAIVTYRKDHYEKAHPTAKETLLVVEVAHSSLPFDRVTKADLYAEFGIPEYWILSVRTNEAIIHTEPTPTGYAKISRVPRNGTLKALHIVDLEIPLSKVFPEAT